MRLKKGVLKDFDSGGYPATVQLAGGYKVYLEDIAVAGNLLLAGMVNRRKVADDILR